MNLARTNSDHPKPGFRSSTGLLQHSPIPHSGTPNRDLAGGSSMITNIQALRGIAALAVVWLHTGYLLFGSFSSQFQGVDIFFVISGFIVSYITERGTNGFIERRISRVLPIYWVITVFAFFWFSLDQFGWVWWLIHDFRQAILQGANLFNSPRNIEILLKSLFFVPYKDSNSGVYTAFLGVGWTLNIEVFFYALFAIFSLAGRRVAMIFVPVVLFSLCVLNKTTNIDGVLVRFYGQSETIYIVGGFVIYAIWRKTEHRLELIKKGWLVAAAILVGVLVIILNVLDSRGVLKSIFLKDVYFLSPLLIVLGALYLHTAGMKCNLRIMLILGNISYSLYLFHFIVLNALNKYSVTYPFLDFRGSFLKTLCAVTLCCFLAWLIYGALEKPLIRFARYVLDRGIRAARMAQNLIGRPKSISSDERRFS